MDPSILYWLLVENLQDYASFSVEPDGSIGTWNLGIERLFGYDAAQFVGRPVSMLFTPEDIANGEVVRVFNVAERFGKCDDERWYVRADGTRTLCRSAILAVREHEGGVSAYFAVLQDITERVRTESELRLQETRYREMVEQAPLSVQIFSPDGKTLCVNRAWMDLWGATIEDLAEYNLFKDEQLVEKGVMPYLMRAFRGEASAVPEIPYRPDRGRYKDETIWVSANIYPVKDESGNVREVVLIHENVTDRKAAEQKLARQARELERSNEELQQFAYVTSHDLQEPLRTISTYSQLLASRYAGRLGADADEFISYIVGEVQRMSALIRDLLTYSRVIGAGAPSLGRVQLRAAADWALMNLGAAIQESGASVEIDPLPVVRGDYVQLVQLFQNLIGNSIKYRRTDRPLRIRISAEHGGQGMWAVSVADNGVGIPEQYRERVFGLFKRLHGRDVPGTGLGLAICRKIVERHGGRTWVEGNEEGGATFRFTLAADPEE
ncbi:MAG: sensor histidine kinase [Bryobacteraceae bacterium]